LFPSFASVVFHGDSFSRCGWWSRFQRIKAASLVSSKRNFSVGDSTCPSQKATLTGHAEAILDFAFSFNGQQLVFPHDTITAGD
jgi:hypothetical protein